MSNLIVRSLTVIFVGLASLLGAFVLLDVELDRETVGGFVLLPVGGVLAIAGVWALISTYIRSD